MPVGEIIYSDRYEDEEFEYRHVTLPAELAKLVPRNHLMTETEWRNLGHFLIYLHSILCISHGLGQRENRIIEMQIWMVKRGKV